jgi:flavin-dependent dehydrogenase
MSRYDVIVMGGGPAGSSAGSLLARRGKKVLVLERELFPRFHIGESLIPMCNDVLKEMGVWDKIRQGGFMVKPGAEFTPGNSCGVLRLWFKHNGLPQNAWTYQVERSKFDKILLDHAASVGCEVRQQARVKEVSFENELPVVRWEENGGQHAAGADWLIDATGRDAFLAKKLGIGKKDIGLPKRVAVYAHFNHTRRNDGEAEGLITIVRLQEGWFWHIPLDATKTSVGLVSPLATFKNSGLEPGAYFEKAVRETSELAYRFKNAERVGGYHVTGDYTARQDRLAGSRWLLAGDAAAFIDPIFSSGVLVALKSGMIAAETVMAAGGRTLSGATQRAYDKRVRAMTERFAQMILMYYDNKSFELFMNPSRFLGLIKAVNQMVSGQTEFTFGVRWRVALFYLLCRLQHWWPVAPRLDFRDKLAPAGASPGTTS